MQGKYNDRHVMRSGSEIQGSGMSVPVVLHWDPEGEDHQ